ncbi:hypothetical protein Mic7113_1739 [Allocoleopsis franciscana PCC 7113]|uniref:Uncharacterized protein n=1 Tax=Allocoleopsis franciscana PCC 7113 TaxID=1173027 RepID=K9WCY7_9CYAN|nr:hypothetical protein Mic7113_1739 [Allocoleopsis franciscana PCC 7113]
MAIPVPGGGNIIVPLTVWKQALALPQWVYLTDQLVQVLGKEF